MAINAVVYGSPAAKGDISGTTITASVALFQIADAFEAIRNGGQPTADQIEKIRASALKLSKLFDDLTGFQE